MLKFRRNQFVVAASRSGICQRGTAVLLSLAVICIASGCGSEAADDGDISVNAAGPVGGTSATYHPPVANGDRRTRIPIPFEYNDLEPAYLPYVFLSEQHSEICLVQVGDRFPDFALPDIHGNRQSLASLLGKTATVVVVWSTDYLFAQEQFDRLPKDLGECYGDPSLSVITIAVGEESDRVRQLADEAGIEGPVLIDSDSVLFHQIATERLPHSYVLDADGQIVWHDLEYSRTTRREMFNAVRFVLTHP